MITFNELERIESRENIVKMFGTSIPTVQRWVSDSNKIPKYVNIILEHLDTIQDLKDKVLSLQAEKREILMGLKNYKEAQDNLFSYLE